jgi:hypothetical protein
MDAMEPKMPRAQFRLLPSGKVVVIKDKAEGESMEAPSPWIALDMKIRTAEVARPPMSDAREKTVRPAINTIFRLKRSEALPPRSRKLPNVRA